MVGDPLSPTLRRGPGGAGFVRGPVLAGFFNGTRARQLRLYGDPGLTKVLLGPTVA
jgi:hypothetical protein